MKHDCTRFKTKPDSVEVVQEFCTDRWVLRSYVTCFADYGDEDHYSVRHEMFIEYCPFCGEELGKGVE